MWCSWKFNNKVGVHGGVLGGGGVLGMEGRGVPWKHGEVCIIPRWGLVDAWVLGDRGWVGGRDS